MEIKELDIETPNAELPKNHLNSTDDESTHTIDDDLALLYVGWRVNVFVNDEIKYAYGTVQYLEKPWWHIKIDVPEGTDEINIGCNHLDISLGIGRFETLLWNWVKRNKKPQTSFPGYGKGGITNIPWDAGIHGPVLKKNK